jgi:hypothetical protein
MTDFITDQSVLAFYQDPKQAINDSLYRAKQRADEWALNKKMTYVVVENGHGGYQVWSKALVGQGCKVVYESRVDSLGN